MVNSLNCAALAGDDSAMYCATEDTSIGNADGVLYRLGYDGSNPTIVASELEMPSRVQASGGFVYWTDRSLSRMAADGTSKMTVAEWDTDYAVSNFIVDGNNIFYVYGGLKVMTITGQNVRSISTGASVRGYAIDSTHIYWSEDAGIYRALKPD